MGSTVDRPLPIPAPVGSMQWVLAAACSHADPSLFFSENDPDTETYDLAKRVYCKDCPVRWECLRFAIENKIQYGLWGGLDAIQRSRPT